MRWLAYKISGKFIGICEREFYMCIFITLSANHMFPLIKFLVLLLAYRKIIAKITRMVYPLCLNNPHDVYLIYFLFHLILDNFIIKEE